MAVRDIVLLGDPRLYVVCDPVARDEVETLEPVIEDLHDTLFAFRRRYGAGRAVAAPQIGVMKRLVYLHVGTPEVLVNPVLHDLSDEMMTLWDDCMSFPDLLVRVTRHRRCRITYRDETWTPHERVLDGDLAELLQHEIDHLDGILAVSRATGPDAFALRSQRALLEGPVVGGP